MHKLAEVAGVWHTSSSNAANVEVVARIVSQTRAAAAAAASGYRLADTVDINVVSSVASRRSQHKADDRGSRRANAATRHIIALGVADKRRAQPGGSASVRAITEPELGGVRHIPNCGLGSFEEQRAPPYGLHRDAQRVGVNIHVDRIVGSKELLQS